MKDVAVPAVGPHPHAYRTIAELQSIINELAESHWTFPAVERGGIPVARCTCSFGLLGRIKSAHQPQPYHPCGDSSFKVDHSKIKPLNQ